MRSGFSDALRQRLRRVDVAARKMIEIVAIAAESVKKTAADWALADSLAGFEIFSDGGVQLTQTQTTAIDQTAFGGGYLNAGLSHTSPYVVAEIAWGNAQSPEAELYSVTVRVNPANGGSQEVQQWGMQLFNLWDEQAANAPYVPTRLVQLVPISQPFLVTSPIVTGDVVFSFAGMPNKPRPGNGISGKRTTFVVLWAQQADGSPAANVGWALDTNPSYSASGHTLTAPQLTQSATAPVATPGSSWFEYSANFSNVPRIKLVWNTGTQATITFTTNPAWLDLPSVLSAPTELDNTTYWVTARASITPNVTTDPLGGATADKLVEDNTTNTHLVAAVSAAAILSGERFTVFAYGKLAERTKVQLQAFNGANIINALYNLSTGALISTSVGGAGVVDSATIDAAPNGFYRLRLTGALNGGATSAIVRVYLLDAAGAVSYLGDGVSGAYLWDLGLTRAPTNTVEFAGTGETPGGSALTYAVQADDATWLPFVDGQTTDDLTAANPTHPITKHAAYKVRATLTPTSFGDGTPTLRTLGVRSLVKYDCSQIAALAGGGVRVDPVSLKSSIADPSLTAIKDGEPDFRDLISTILSSYHIGQLSVRVYWGAEDLARGSWGHYDTYLVDDYEDAAGGVTVKLLSVLVLLRGVLPVFNPNTGLREALVYDNQSIATIWADLVSGQVGLPGQYLGEGPTDSALLRKTIPSNAHSPLTRPASLLAKLMDQQGWQTVQAKDQVDGVGYIAGGATIASQGRIKWVPICVGDVITRPDGSLGFAITRIDAPRVTFYEGEVQWLHVGPGFSERVPEFYASYNWNVEVQKFGFQHRAYNGPALVNLGVGRVSSQPTVLDTDVAQWLVSDDGTLMLPTSSLARRVSARQATLLGTGLMLWRFRSTYAYPELEPGDVVNVPTDRFLALNPISGGRVIGRYTASAVIVETEPNGHEFGVWIRQWSDLAPALADVSVTPTVTLPATDLVLNGDFENTWSGVGSGVLPEYWAPGSNGILSLTTGYSGAYAIRVNVVTGNATAYQVADPNGMDFSRYRYLRVTAGDVLNVHAASADQNDAAVGFRTFDANFAFVADDDVLTWVGGTLAWIPKDGTYTVPAGVYYVVVKLRSTFGGVGSFFLRMDEVRVRY